MSLLFRALGALPFWVLYMLSDVIFAVVYYLVHYRRRLVRANLAAAFPDMSTDERRKVERRFYRNFCDYFVETLKLSSISDEEICRRMVFDNPELIDGLLDRGLSVAVYFNHCFNWEWAPSVTLWSAHATDPKVRFCQVYRPLKNEGFDRWFLKLRSRFHSVSLAKHSVARDLLRMRRDGLLSVTGFMSDQRVSHLDSPLPVSFLGRPTEAILGTELLASKLGLAAVYWDLTRTSRGHYRITTRLISDNPAELPQGELTRRYFSLLETTIRRDPANWLWSHNRWKRVNHPNK